MREGFYFHSIFILLLPYFLMKNLLLSFSLLFLSENVEASHSKKPGTSSFSFVQKLNSRRGGEECTLSLSFEKNRRRHNMGRGRMNRKEKGGRERDVESRADLTLRLLLMLLLMHWILLLSLPLLLSIHRRNPHITHTSPSSTRLCESCSQSLPELRSFQIT